MDALETLAYHVRETTTEDGYRQLAARAGIASSQFNYVYRAAHPGGAMPGGRILNPVIHGNLAKLLKELRLTFAPIEDHSPPTTAHICMLIGLMDAPREARQVAIAAVHAAGLMKIQSEEPKCV